MAWVVMCSQNMPVPKDPRVWREARALSQAGHTVTVISPRGSGMPRREVLDDVEILRYPSPPEATGIPGLVLETANALVWTTLLAAWLRRRGTIDVLHAANPPDTFFLVGRLLRRDGTRFVFDHHDAAPELLRLRNGGGGWQEWLLRRLETASHRAADLVITPNNAYRSLATGRGGVPADRVVTVRTGIDRDSLPVLQARERTPGAPVSVGFAGVLGEHDGVDTFLRASAEVLRRRPGAIVVEVIGDGPAAPMLRQLAVELGIDDAVCWAGWVEGSAFHERVARLDLAVSADPAGPYNRISTMIKLIDYVSVGCPVVASDTPSNRETAGEAARYVRPGDVADLASAIESLVVDDGARAALAEQARHRSPLLRWQLSAERLVAAYRFLLDEGAGPGREQVLDDQILR